MTPETTQSLSLWTVPLRNAHFGNSAGLNERLAQVIKAREPEIRSGVPTEVAGLKEGITTHWQEYNVLKWPESACAEFRDLLLAQLHDFLEQLRAERGGTLSIAGIACWANILRYGQSLRIHHHDPAFLLGNYCVQTGYDRWPDEESEEGHTVYFRPGFLDRSQEGLWDRDWRHSIRPVPGQLVMCPGFVRHEVRPYLGESERISIAFDCYVREQNVLVHFGGARWYTP